MPSVYFDNFNNYSEQDLIESLINESLSIYGHTVYYLPRTLISKDDIYGEDTLSKYTNAYEFDVYIKSYDSYEGDGTFLSKFNLEIRDSVTFTIARRTFGREVSTQQPDIQRPREGDLIYSTMMKRMFVVKYVNQTAIFYQMGSLQLWDVACDVWEYSNEDFNTGIYEIDSIETKYSVSNITNDTAYEKAMSNVFETNVEFQAEGDGLIDWSDIDPFSQGQV
jgi:hypothetical protein